MADQLSFKDYLKKTVLQEEQIPSVWDKKVKNVVSQEDEEITATCPECKGDGQRYGDLCPTCDGHGEVKKSKVDKYHQHDSRGMDPRDDEEYDEDEEVDEVDMDEDDPDVNMDQAEDEDYDDEFNDPETMDDEDANLDDEEPEDPNKMGVIRKVDNAHLVYKRQDEEGTFEELWMYHIGEVVDDELDIRRNILAGTDIPAGSMKSEDGTQFMTLWTTGNIQMLNIKGLPN